MNYGQLKQRLSATAHRTDLALSLPFFVEDARLKINARYGIKLAAFVNDSDTNGVLTNNTLLYLYASLQSLYEFLNDGDNARYYSGLWDIEAANQNINAASSDTDPYTAAPPVIVPYGGSMVSGTGGGGSIPDPLVLDQITGH